MALATPEINDEGKVRLTEPSAKLDAVQELLEDHPDKKYVIFSSSKQICYLARDRFTRRGIESFVLSGDTPQRERDGMVQRFVEGDARAFIAVIEAGGEGIDGLQYATDTCIFLDRSWSAKNNEQAIGRLDRDGQKNTTQVIDIMARNTIDLGRRQKLERTWNWIKELLDGKIPQA